jgi:hypothetical protein
MENAKIPLPAALMQPWIDDAAAFQREIKAREEQFGDLSRRRETLASEIRSATPAVPCGLGAVDAASLPVPFADLTSILLQVVHVKGDGTQWVGPPARVTGVDGEEIHLASMPMRVAAECAVLAEVTEPTIADTSFWSVLMEVNMAITRVGGSNHPALRRAVTELVQERSFLRMLANPNIFPMSKKSQSETYVKGMSDRHSLGLILLPGEYLTPRKLTDGTTGKFGVHRMEFTSTDSDRIRSIYDNELSVLFYKPHPWTRAFRIEGHRAVLRDDRQLMPLLAAVAAATARSRTVVEPWPQFLADYTAKCLAAVMPLYGKLNLHRLANVPFVRTRTR